MCVGVNATLVIVLRAKSSTKRSGRFVKMYCVKLCITVEKFLELFEFRINAQEGAQNIFL